MANNTLVSIEESLLETLSADSVFSPACSALVKAIEIALNSWGAGDSITGDAAEGSMFDFGCMKCGCGDTAKPESESFGMN